MSYFLADVHDKSIPETCFVARLRAMVAKYSDDSVSEDEVLNDFLLLAAEFPQFYLAFPILRLHSFFMKQSVIVEMLAARGAIEDCLVVL